MEYNFRDIEKKWQQYWDVNKVYKVSNDFSKPKCYVLDMFPYPSGSGLHVGHPLGYIASDIYARYKRLKGFNVLHPMGYDAFGLPAEQYAIDHGIHPAVSTENNIKNFRSQLDKIGFCFDWSREVNTSKPEYYKWTQWIFLQLFQSFYNRTTNKAEPISNLIAAFEKEGNKNHPIPDSKFQLHQSNFSAAKWKAFNEKVQQEILMEYRLAYCGIGEVNWCEGLGTVLANDEVINGVSERGGYPVVKKKLRQWYLRITEYGDRLLEGLNKVDFSEAMKEMQSNWIGKSSGAEIDFRIQVGESEESKETTTEIVNIDGKEVEVTSETITETVGESEESLRVYTTRPDTIFGVDFMVLAPEHELVEEITTDNQKNAVEEYLAYVKSRSERERMAEKKLSGVFTGSYAINPFNGRAIPIWISEYVLAGYGTGAIMGVPCGDERDHRFAKQFDIPITNIIGSYYNGEEANPTYDAKLENSDFLNGIEMRKAAEIVIAELELAGLGKRKINYKMRDAAFSRQRYWGEPFPIVWKNRIAYPLDERELPLKLPEVDSYKPGPEGEGPLANIKDWTDKNLETNTMPGYAGSSWYFLRYMDPHNDKEFCNRKISDYWNQVDLYIGGTEHAVGHLLYSRMWTKCLFDLGLIGFDEPYKKLVNQGMITGNSYFVMGFYALNLEATAAETEIDQIYRKRFGEFFISIEKFDNEGFNTIFELNGKKYRVEDISEFQKSRIRYAHFFVDSKNQLTKQGLINTFKLDDYSQEEIEKNLQYIFWDGVNEEGEEYIQCKHEFEKMSKSKYNTVNPDDLVVKYGADTFRMYEMFLGPVEMSKPWDTKGIEGVHRFLKKLWRLFFDEVKGPIWTTLAPSPSERAGGEATEAELKVLHKTIKKIEEDTERFSFNTGVSAFMICVNELTDLKCHKKEILEPLLILLTPYAPHIAEELWSLLGNKATIVDASFPKFEEKYITETSKEYPVSINGKLRTTMNFSLDADQTEVERIVLENEIVKKWMDGKTPKKIIYVKNKMINVVI